MFEKVWPLMSRKLRNAKPKRRRFQCESLESRHLLATDALPVLMVIADRQDFFYQEYGDTRISLEEAGLTVEVAATTTQPSTPHPNSGQGSSSGIVTPDRTLASVDSANYSAIVFVGGWGSSMYQNTTFPGTYSFSPYNGNAATKEVVNQLINDFISEEKPVTAICHAVTVLAWARVNGVSPIQGKTVSTPALGSPASTYNGVFYNSTQLKQRTQVEDNGATTFNSGAIGNPATQTDDVWVDGKIITAENNFAARQFGHVVAQAVLANVTPTNDPPIVTDATFSIPENSLVGTAVGTVSATDPDAGQQLTYSITSGNSSGAFAINPATGAISVVNTTPLDFEATSKFSLTVTTTDNGSPVASGSATITINLSDVVETPLNHAPMVSTATLSLPENSAVGTPVGTVSATDSDAGQQLVYSITGGNSSGAFQINPATGAISVAKVSPLDFETTAKFSLTVTATDNGSPVASGSATITVNLSDVVETPLNHAPAVSAATFTILENSPFNTVVGQVYATDVDAGQTLSYFITGGNSSGAFAIEASTGKIFVASFLPLDFETSPTFQLTIAAKDNGSPAAFGTAVITVKLTDAAEPLPSTSTAKLVGANLEVRTTSGNDTIYIYANSQKQIGVWVNGAKYQFFTLGNNGKVIVNSGDGKDIISTLGAAMTAPLDLRGEAGDDCITGGPGADLINGGPGNDVLMGGAGQDIIWGVEGDDQANGQDGNDILVGGVGNDRLYGGNGRDLMIGGAGSDTLYGGADEDLLIGGSTSYDWNKAALLALINEWGSTASASIRLQNIRTGLSTSEKLAWNTTLTDDSARDYLQGDAGPDIFFRTSLDQTWGALAEDTSILNK